MLRLLSLETATDQGSFALWSGDVTSGVATTAYCENLICPAGQPHAETLLPAVRTSLATLGWTLPQLDAIVFDAGPGMFTGLRVSAALAQGLAFALNKPLIPVSSLQVLAETAYATSGATRVISLLDARMQQIYAASWVRDSDVWVEVSPATLLNPTDLGRWYGAADIPPQVAGTALSAYPEVADWCAGQKMTDSQVRYPAADALARLGAVGLVNDAAVDPAAALPVYVRDRVALTTAERAAGETL